MILEEKVSNSRTVFRLPRKWEEDVYVVYDKPRNTFVTVYKKGEDHTGRCEEVGELQELVHQSQPGDAVEVVGNC